MKTLKVLLASLLICVTLIGSVSAVGCVPAEPAAENGSVEVQPRAEETVWYYKNVDGIVYARLWSLTYGKWLTDWIALV